MIDIISSWNSHFILEIFNVMNDFQQPSKKPQGDKYSVYVVYKNSQEAQQAYEDVKGNQEKVHIICRFRSLL